jgi:hypothetical protein
MRRRVRLPVHQRRFADGADGLGMQEAERPYFRLKMRIMAVNTAYFRSKRHDVEAVPKPALPALQQLSVKYSSPQNEPPLHTLCNLNGAPNPDQLYDCRVPTATQS